MDIVFVHGWGFGPDVWTPLASKLPGKHHFINLGFIDGFDDSPAIPDNSIVIGHSLGVLWAMRHIERPKALISIAGFHDFTKAQPEAALRAMQRRLGKDPAGLMADFWALCDSPLTYEAGRLNTEKLAKGLEWLQNWNVPLQKMHCATLCLAAMNDNIIPKNITAKEWNDVHWSEEGGHILPLTKATWCAEIIEGFLDAIDTQGDHCE